MIYEHHINDKKWEVYEKEMIAKKKAAMKKMEDSPLLRPVVEKKDTTTKVDTDWNVNTLL